MRQKSMFATMSSLSRSGARLWRSTTKLLAQVNKVAKPSKPAKPAARAQPGAKPGAKPEVKHGAPPASASPFSPNPGGLLMESHVPKDLAPGAPLVVLLHGCGQEPVSFSVETGWRRLADANGWALLMPRQTEANNGQLCFNWFRPGDTGRDLGEAGSIAAMVRAMVKAHRCDPKRVFVTGLSAGGAMTACLLAAYPDIFAGGAVVAGLPAGSASGVVGAMTRMAGRGADLSPADWLARARALAPVAYAGSWPRLQIWHGDADTTVAPVNGTQLAVQWTALMGIETAPAHRDGASATRESWGDPARPAVEICRVAGMGHVYPPTVAPQVAKFWGLAG